MTTDVQPNAVSASEVRRRELAQEVAAARREDEARAAVEWSKLQQAGGARFAALDTARHAREQQHAASRAAVEEQIRLQLDPAVVAQHAAALAALEQARSDHATAQQVLDRHVAARPASPAQVATWASRRAVLAGELEAFGLLLGDAERAAAAAQRDLDVARRGVHSQLVRAVEARRAEQLTARDAKLVEIKELQRQVVTACDQRLQMLDQALADLRTWG